MTEHISSVTCNHQRNALLKSLLELGLTAFAFYYMAHPDMTDNIKAAVGRWWQRFLHAVSIRNTFRDIHSLPETDE